MLLPILPVALPLLVAAILAAAAERAPHRLAHTTAVLTAVVTAAACAALALASRAHPLVHWFGGWTPRAGVCLGIGFAVDPIGAGLAALSGVLVALALLFAGAYFDADRSRFYVLVLVFLAALSGFGLTGDLFDLFVFFELMSAASFALTGFKSKKRGPIQGAINIAVTNTVGAVLVLLGIALVYGRTGALNLAQAGRALGAHGDALTIVAFTLLTSGFAVKAALAPFHFWLADAHAVAPAPVSVLFSGVMVEAGVYAIARLWGSMFQGALGPREAAARGALAGMGALTVIVGGVMCVAQRHLKRLLAFSTIAHVGVTAMAVATLDAEAVGGAAVYALGHGFAKGALFLCVGVLLHRLSSVDELALRGRGRRLRLVGVVFAAGGLALAGLPPFGLARGETGMDAGAGRAGYGWTSAVSAVGAVLTGAAVLRAAGRVFLGLGPRRPDAPEVGGETSEARETKGHRREVPWTMWLPPVVLLILSLVVGLAPGLGRAAREGAAMLLDKQGYAAWVLEGHGPVAAPPSADGSVMDTVARGLILATSAVALAAAMLFREALPASVRRPIGRAWGAVRLLRALHCGRVGDYVAWLVVGVVALGAICFSR